MTLVFGLDLGIASVGWAALDDASEQVIAAGSWTFDAPENDKDRTPLNAIRRQQRGQRRVIRRRADRMAKVRHLLHRHELLDEADSDALRHRPGLDPWRLRAEGLAQRLDPLELAIALGHIARHRGFRSNSKRDHGANAASDDKKMLGAMEATRSRLEGRTPGQMLATDPAFQDRKRNRAGDYSRTLLRADLEAEARRILAAQRRLGSQHASDALEAEYMRAAFFQRPLKDSEDKVGPCPFEPGQRRTARRAPSFERFRFLTRLASLRLVHGGEKHPLTPEQIALASEGFGKQASISFTTLRRALDLDPGVAFADVARADEKRDVVARTGNAAEGTKALRDALGESGWRAMLARPNMLDHAAEIITFRDDLARIREGLVEAGVDADALRALMAGVEQGRFAQFRGAGHISALAARTLLPHLARGLDYTEACKDAGYDHAARPAASLDDVRNPVARKALGQALKQVRAMVRAFGRPDRIHVELARDLGRSAEERAKVTKGLEERTAKRNKHRGELEGHLARAVTDDELLRYELWKEQNGRCLYTDEPIAIPDLATGSARVQVDHILPWSRFGDDSFINKALVTAKANQDKGGCTPFEWFGEDTAAAEWAAFALRVEGCREMKGYKKRGHYLRQNAKEVEERFRSRNLNDTRYAARVLRHVLEDTYGKQGTKVSARPGALTAKLRRAWGLEGWKKDADGKRRADDRHHALDAIVLAATTDSMVNRLTLAFQEAEWRGTAREFGAVGQPWPGFREQVEAVLDKVFVARAERRRVPGALHEATIRQVRVRDGEEVVFERVPIEKLKLGDLDRVKDKERNAGLVEALRAWIEAGKPKDAPPRSPKVRPEQEDNPPIRKVRLATNDNVAVTMRGGTAERGEMARVDVFREVDAKNRKRFHMVPIYPHQVAGRTLAEPPSLAVVAAQPESQWTPVQGFDFLFSLHHNSLVEVVKPDGEIIRGYLKGLSRSTAAFSISDHLSQQTVRPGIGTKTLRCCRKLLIDRLGTITEVERETRRHGMARPAPDPPGAARARRRAARRRPGRGRGPAAPRGRGLDRARHAPGHADHGAHRRLHGGRDRARHLRRDAHALGRHPAVPHPSPAGRRRRIASRGERAAAQTALARNRAAENPEPGGRARRLHGAARRAPGHGPPGRLRRS